MNAKVWSVGASALVLAVFAWNASAATVDDAKRNGGDPEQQRVAIGFKIAPLPLDMRHRNKELVGLGSYIVNAQAACNDCHGNPVWAAGHDPYQGQPAQVDPNGYLVGGQQFGPFTSRNLRKEDNGLPAGMTYAQFKEVLRTGHDLDNAHPQFGPLLQVMPWPAYSNMTDHDLQAIYEYLMALPAPSND